MTANQFAETYKFTENDKFVVNKMFGKEERTEDEWFKELSTDFAFSKKEFVLNKTKAKKIVEADVEENDIKPKKSKK